MRITNHIRVALARALIDHKFAAARAALRKREEDLAETLYRVAIPEEVEKLTDQLNGKMPGMVGQMTTIYIYWESRQTALSLPRSRPCPTTLDFPKLIKSGWTDAEISALSNFRESQDNLKQAIAAADTAAMAVLNKCNTAKQLRAAWPEAMPVFEPILVKAGMDAPVNLPAIDTKTLNSMFDLPIETKEAA